MATIITDGGKDGSYQGFNQVAYVNNSWNDPEYLRSVNERARQYEESLTGRGRELYNNLPENLKVTIDVDEYMRNSRAALAASKQDLTRIEAFISLQEVEAIQRPPKVMRNYLLAQPTIHREVRANRLQGYDEPLVDQPLWRAREDGVKHIKDNPYYQQVMVGKVVEDGDQYYRIGNYVAVSVGEGAHYEQLTPADRQSVLDVWEMMMKYHDQGHDVTSPGGGMR